MNSQNVSSLVEELKAKISGEIKFDESTLLMYSTDASAYREKPLFVVYPKDDSDIKNLILFARSNKMFFNSKNRWYLTCRSGGWKWNYC